MPDSFIPIGDLGRSRFLPELQDPAVRDRLIAYTKAEVGGQGPQAQQAFMETIFNRATARNQPLRQVLSGSYFPGETHARAARGVGQDTQAAYAPILSQVLGGSNIANYATGNASGNVGFAGGPQTYAAGGERYGVEGPDRGWWTRVGAEGPSNTQAVGYTGQGGRRSPGGAPVTQGGVAGALAALAGSGGKGSGSGTMGGLSGPFSAFSPSYGAPASIQPIQFAALDQIGSRRYG